MLGFSRNSPDTATEIGLNCRR